MSYDGYRYLFPPRPEKAIPYDLIGFYAQRGYLGQVKKNGTCTVIFANGDVVLFKTRHNEDHKAWTAKPEMVSFFADRSDQWNVYVGELLHSKVPGIRDHLYLFDILVHDGRELTGTTLAERMHQLQLEFPAQDRVPAAGVGAIAVGPDVSRAAIYTGADIDKAWKSLRDHDEGIVLKNPAARLEPCITASSNSGWQIKCRRASKKYSF